MANAAPPTDSPSPASTSIFASLSPAEIAQKVEQVGVAKARSPFITVMTLSVLAGAFISIGALFYTVTTTDPTLGVGVTRLLGGLSFCVGLILVVIGGAELFTGNNLLAMAWASGLISTRLVAAELGRCLRGQRHRLLADRRPRARGQHGQPCQRSGRAKSHCDRRKPISVLWKPAPEAFSVMAWCAWPSGWP